MDAAFAARAPGYALGWDHGFEAGVASVAQPEGASSNRKLLAAGTLIAGLGSAAGLIVSLNPRYARYRPAFATVAVTSLVLGAFVSSLQVLRGNPTPNLGL